MNYFFQAHLHTPWAIWLKTKYKPW